MTAPRRVAAAFSRSDLARAERELLRDGRWANARVEKVTLDGVAWTFKDFSSRPFFVRNTIDLRSVLTPGRFVACFTVTRFLSFSTAANRSHITRSPN